MASRAPAIAASAAAVSTGGTSSQCSGSTSASAGTSTTSPVPALPNGRMHLICRVAKAASYVVNRVM